MSSKKVDQNAKAPSKKAKPPKSSDHKEALSGPEKTNLAQLEGTIGNGFFSFMSVGLALDQINVNKLYRASATTFAEYCQKRWDITDRYAYRQIEAAKCMRSLKDEFSSSDKVLPLNEAQIRPIYEGFDKPTGWIKAWKKVLDATGGKEITAEKVARVVNQMQGKPAKKDKPSKQAEQSIPKKMLKAVTEAIDKALRKRKGADGQYFRKVLEEIKGLIDRKSVV